MLERIIASSIRRRWLVLLITLCVAGLGIDHYGKLPIDAVPDITNVQVQINTEVPGLTPLEVEQRITLALEIAIAGVPKLDHTRSISRYGLSQITAIFDDDTDIYFARQLLNERLQEARDRLPPGTTPSLGPISTGLGEIFLYVVQNEEGSGSHSPSELRTVQDWIIKPQLRNIKGVADINSIGGYEKQYLVTPSQERLQAYDLTFDDLIRALVENHTSAGAGYIERNGEQYLVRSPGQIQTTEEIGKIVVKTHHNIPILIRDVADISQGTDLRNGAATKDGKEVVLGTVFMLKGQNSREVSTAAAQALAQIRRSLPPGISAIPVYNRTDLVNATIRTVKKNLFEGAVLVIVVLFLFLGNIRAALVTALVIPLSMLFTITGMVRVGVSGNLMSLGAIDFGLIVDGAVIVVENCLRALTIEQRRVGRLLSPQERLRVVFDATREVRQSTLFGELIIMVVYLPILTLTGIEGKLFHPMAYTVILALLGAMICSLTFVPAAVALCVTAPITDHQDGIISRLQAAYQRVLRKALEHSRRIIGAAVTVLALTVTLAGALGSEFIPSLDEGDVALHALRIPGTSLTQAVHMQHELERKLKQVPEVATSFGKIGTAEIANDPMPPSVTDGYVMMRPRAEWRDPDKSREQLVRELERAVADVPGNNYEFTQPIEMRFNELIAGVRSDLAIKVFGDELETLLPLGKAVEEVLMRIPGAADVKVEQVSGLPFLSISPDRERLARYGISLAQVQRVIQIAIAGHQASELFEGDRRFPIVVRLPEQARNSIEQIKQLPIPVPVPAGPALLQTGYLTSAQEALQRVSRYFVPLEEVADVLVTEGPNQISREDGKRRIVVTANIRGRPLGSFVKEAQTTIEREVRLPTDYWIAWGGQFEHLISARARLMVVIPTALLLILGLLYISVGTLTESLLVFTGVPLALTGGVAALWLRGIPFSISAAIGFIALSGVAVLNGLVMVTFIKKLIADGVALTDAVVQGSAVRLRPVLMTALVASLGFLPMALSSGTGSEVQRPLATVVIGGLISSTLLTLFVLPVLFRRWGGRARAPGD